MTENGNKGGSALLFLLSAVALIIVMLRIGILQLSGVGGEPIYDDPQLSISLVRGSILDRNGSYLAIQAPDYGFQIHLNDASPAEAAAFISSYTRENAISIENRIENGEDFIRVSQILSTDEMKMIMQEESELSLLDDITPSSVERRKYPFPATSAIVGNVDGQMKGISGIERLCNAYLSPVPSIYSAVAHGSDIHLTIDSAVQGALGYIMQSVDPDGEAAIISPDNEILAWWGKAPDRILTRMIAAEGETRKNATSPFRYTEEISDGYRAYIHSEHKDEILTIMEDFLSLK